MKHFYPIQIIDLRFHLDHINPEEKNQIFEEYGGRHDDTCIDAGLFTILIRRRELKPVSEGNEIKDIKVK